MERPSADKLQKGRDKVGLHDIKDCLIIGLEGVGKTIIIRRLQELDSDDLNSYTRPTVGMEREEIKYNHSTFLIAEYGSKMLANWNKMFTKQGSTKTIIFVVDSQNYEQLPASQAEFEILIANPELKNKPILLLFNKIDGMLFYDANMLTELFNIDEHKANNKNFEAMFVSAATGENCTKIIEWIEKLSNQVDNKKSKPIKNAKKKGGCFPLFCCSKK